VLAKDLDAAQKDLASLEKRFALEARTRKEWVAQISAAVETVERQLSADRAAAEATAKRLRLCLDAEIDGRGKLEFRTGVEIARFDQTINTSRESARQEFNADITRLAERIATDLQMCVETGQRLRECLDAEIAAREHIGFIVGRLDPSLDHNLDGLYVAFEEAFRGNRADIKNRQREYLPYLQNAGIGSPEMAILDIGCGRGEWLELLRETGLQARGVDRNRAMAAICRELGLNVEEKEALECLRELPDASLGAITASHVVEQVPFPYMIGMIDEAVRALKPGGLLILETPNPQNIQVGTHTFYLDPTHRNPLPPAMLKFFVEARGFSAVQILPLHPYPEEASVVTRNSELTRRFNASFYGPQDYAVIGRKA
jgi:SAM-dependent methyltransferase